MNDLKLVSLSVICSQKHPNRYKLSLVLKSLAPLVNLSLFSSPWNRVKFRGPCAKPGTPALSTPEHVTYPWSIFPLEEPGRTSNFLVAKAHTFHMDSFSNWAFCSGVTRIAFPWMPSNVFSILALVFLNPSAEFQLWAHQLSPDYFLCICQVSFLTWVTMLFLLYQLVNKQVSLPTSPPWAVCHSCQIQSPPDLK